MADEVKKVCEHCRSRICRMAAPGWFKKQGFHDWSGDGGKKWRARSFKTPQIPLINRHIGPRLGSVFLYFLDQLAIIRHVFGGARHGPFFVALACLALSSSLSGVGCGIGHPC